MTVGPDYDRERDEYERTHCWNCGCTLEVAGDQGTCPRCRTLAEAIKAYEAQYPQYCRPCGGTGMLYDPGVYRYPDGSGEPPSVDICDGCLGVGTCPRCGAEKVFGEYHGEDSDTCPKCGWKASDGGIPAF